MTDRLHSCKDSPNGRHHRMLVALVNDRPLRGDQGQSWRMCHYCGNVVEVLDAGWNAPAHDPDAHLGIVGTE